jgi:hypothetical protein
MESPPRQGSRGAAAVCGAAADDEGPIPRVYIERTNPTASRGGSDDEEDEWIRKLIKANMVSEA